MRCGLWMPALALVVSCATAERRETPSSAPPASVTRAEPEVPALSDARLRAIIAPILAESPQRAVGIVIRAAGRTRVFGYGRRAVGDPRPPDGASSFELGSIAKVFAGVLLADAVRRGELTLEDPLRKHVTPTLRVPERGERPIRLVDLATHASGLPMMPDNFIPLDPVTHRTRYTLQHFRSFLQSHRLPFEPGSRYAYGNVSTALLAMALADKTGLPYHALLEQRLFAPLGMRRSGYVDRPWHDTNLIDGYDEHDVLMPKRVDTSPLGPCCAVRSSLSDMARFIEAVLEPRAPLAEAFAVAARPRIPIDADGSEQSALGWVVRRRDASLSKTGQVAGYRSILILLPETRLGVFAMINSERSDISWLGDEIVGELTRSDSTELRGKPRLPKDLAPHESFVVRALPPEATRTDVRFADAMRLEGWIAPRCAARGATSRVSAFYRVLRPLDRVWRVFVHGDATTQAPRIPADHYPGAGRDSTLVWKPGELVRDAFEIHVPADYPAGRFVLWMGWYRGSKRMKISKSSVESKADKARTVELDVCAP